jgi:hypothetical protein
MHGQDASLVISIPLSDPGKEGLGSLADLDFRHQLEAELDDALRQRHLGHVDGGGAGLGWQDLFMLVPSSSWEAAWNAVRATLHNKGLLTRAHVTLSIPGEQPRLLWEASTPRRWATRIKGFLIRLVSSR